MHKPTFAETVNAIVKSDPRYDRGSYSFVREGLDYTLKLNKRNGQPAARHVTGQELLEGLRRYALEQFGPMAKTVLEYWGIEKCVDFGEIVFNMVKEGILGKTEQDNLDDFKDGYDFDEAFVKPYRPTPRSLVRRESAPARPSERYRKNRSSRSSGKLSSSSN
jgi:uncharacterized repeat protein (TIGR04138 family)